MASEITINITLKQDSENWKYNRLWNKNASVSEVGHKQTCDQGPNTGCSLVLIQTTAAQIEDIEDVFWLLAFTMIMRGHPLDEKATSDRIELQAFNRAHNFSFEAVRSTTSRHLKETRILIDGEQGTEIRMQTVPSKSVPIRESEMGSPSLVRLSSTVPGDDSKLPMSSRNVEGGREDNKISFLPSASCTFRYNGTTSIGTGGGDFRVSSKSALVRPPHSWLQSPSSSWPLHQAPRKKEKKQVFLDCTKNQVLVSGTETSFADIDERNKKDADASDIEYKAGSTDVNHQRWYSKSDYARMHMETQETIRMIERGLPERLGVCYRGLEHHIFPSVRTVNIIRALRLVLDHQDMMLEEGESEEEQEIGPADEIVAKRYAVITRSSRDTAHRVALSDARTAKSILSSSGTMDTSPKPPQRRRRWKAAPAC